MTTINSTTNQNNYSSTTGSSEAADATTTDDGSVNTNENTTLPPSDQVILSSRASKIQKLNEEFFPGGPKTVTITPEFIQRLSEYGLISAEEATKLDTSASESDQKTDPLDEISKFIDVMSDKISQQDPQSSLIETLSKAKNVIDGFGINSAATNSDIKTIMAQLNEFRQSDQGLLLSDAEKVNMDQLELALSVADQMNPQNSSSEQLANYVAIYNQSQQ